MILFIIITELSFYRTNENFENITENIGNYLCSYFYHYVVSVLNKSDFNYNINSNSDIIKYLPTTISYNPEIYSQLKESGITSEMVKSVCDVCIWYCDDNWKIKMWEILKPTINQILDDALQKSGLKRTIHYPIIHFRCADTPFIKHPQYFFQNYKFFKAALDKLESKHVIIMANTKHDTGNEQQESCTTYAYKLRDYITSLGYQATIETRTNIEDFSDLFYAPAVISTGSSFSFMSGFFGNGIFITTEHCKENDKCNVKHEKFINGYNIKHSNIESYHDIDSVYSFLTSE